LQQAEAATVTGHAAEGTTLDNGTFTVERFKQKDGARHKCSRSVLRRISEYQPTES
jgi:hypothetical protein